MVKKDVEIDQAVLMSKFEYISRSLDQLKVQIDELPARFVSQDEFKPIKSVVYGVVGLLLTSIVVAITSLVIRK